MRMKTFTSAVVIALLGIANMPSNVNGQMCTLKYIKYYTGLNCNGGEDASKAVAGKTKDEEKWPDTFISIADHKCKTVGQKSYKTSCNAFSVSI